MARIRSLKPEFFRSRSLQACSLHARVTFQGLWCEADDYGNGIADPRLLKGALWALDDDVTWQDVETWLEELAKTKHIELYEIDRERYYSVCRFGDHQVINRKSKPRVPAQHVDSEDAVSAQSVDTEDASLEVEGSEERGGEVARADNAFALTDDLRAWALEHAYTSEQIANETEKFRLWSAAHGRDFTDWGAGWQHWMLRAVPEGRPAAEPRPDCEHCANSGWVLPDGSERTVRCVCNPKLAGVG